MIAVLFDDKHPIILIAMAISVPAIRLRSTQALPLFYIDLNLASQQASSTGRVCDVVIISQQWTLMFTVPNNASVYIYIYSAK